MSGIAHMQFSSGGFVMPADSPYDRQLLREHVQTLIQPGSTVQLRLHGNEWTLMRLGGARPCCTTCAEPLRLLGCRIEDDGTPLCIECVLRLKRTDERLGG